MKHLKKLTYLFFAFAILIGCETEEVLLNQDRGVENLKIEDVSSKSILQVVESGIDLKEYFNNLNKIKKIESASLEKAPDDMVVPVQFYYNSEDFDCTNLPMQNFEETIYGGAFSAPIDEYTNTVQFSPGDILSGISFDTSRGNKNSNFFVPSNSWGYSKNVLMSNYYEGDLILNFSSENVYDVSMKLYNLQNSTMYVRVYGVLGNYLGQGSVYYKHPADRSEGVFIAMHSEEPIAKIVIISDYIYGHEGIDEVEFGNCNDADGDGISNEEDPHPNSNISDELSFDGCYPGVINQFSAPGTTMMDEVDDVIAGVWEMMYSPNKRRNFDPQKQFQRDMSVLLNSWYRRYDALVTDAEKFEITKCVRISRIFQEPER